MNEFKISNTKSKSIEPSSHNDFKIQFTNFNFNEEKFLDNISENLNNNQNEETDISNDYIVLTEIEGSLLGKKQIKITQNTIDGVDFENKELGLIKFGRGKLDFESVEVNDYILKLPSLQTKNRTLFALSLNTSKNEYLLKTYSNDLNDNLVIFIKIEKPFKLIKKQIVSLGNVHISIDIDKNKLLTLVVVDHNSESKIIKFKKENKLVRFGRNKENEIYLNSSSYSRIHSTIYYDENEQDWFIDDGHESKKSVNGTWIYLDNEWLINDVTTFRMGYSLFVINTFKDQSVTLNCNDYNIT